MRRRSFERLLAGSGRDWGLALSQTPEFIFRRKYGLAPTDPRFLACTLDDIVVDVWAHAHTDNPKLRDEYETEDFDGELAAMEAEIAARPDAPVPEPEPEPEDFAPVFEDRFP